MKTIKLSLAALTLFAAFTFTSCKEETPVVEEEVVVEEGLSGDFSIDTSSSSLEWLGKKVTGEHYGTISIAEGKFSLANSVLTSGTVVVDMASITVVDLEDAEMNAKLLGHLKSEDFFDVANNPTAILVITEADDANAAADLTIKGMTNPVKFAYEVSETETEVVLTGKVVVDRTLYDIKYGSGKFFEDLGDKTINDEFELNFKAVAKK